MLEKYRPTYAETLHEQRLATTQVTSVGKHQRGFIKLVTLPDDVLENIMIGQFLDGLKEDIKVESPLFNPYTLEQKMDLAIRA